eukprot:g7168.t1
MKFDRPGQHITCEPLLSLYHKQPQTLVLMVTSLAMLALGVVIRFPTSYGNFNVPGWRDKYESGCDIYEDYPSSCSNLPANMNSGYTPNGACRVCGGGISGCDNTASWLDDLGNGCAYYDFNPSMYCGTFANSRVGTGGQTANTACCSCSGGFHQLYCSNLPIPSNGGIGTCTSDKKTGNECSITCNNGYSQSGGAKQYCQGSTWSPKQSAFPNSQSCVAANCPSLATPSNGAINTCTSTKTTGQTCTITCNNGYSVSGGSTQTCTGTGVGSSAWPNSQSCAAATCAVASTPSNGGIGTCDGTKTTGQTCTITCNNGYAISGGSTQTCTGTGDGTSAWPICSHVQLCRKS